MRLAVFQPDIAANLGAMIRTAACFGCPVDVIEPCGFPFSVKALRRAAMDYADIADVTRHDDWSAFRAAQAPDSRLVVLSTKGAVDVWDHAFKHTDVYLMGRESAGLPDHVHAAADAVIRIPMPGGGRSLNVSVSAGIILAEALRHARDHTQITRP
ncbi:MAG: tRNA (cytidine(34)-2'-O)-methyltransferase [Pseudomonadota bacterium]